VHPICPRYVYGFLWVFRRTAAPFYPILTAFFLFLCQIVQFSRPKAAMS
jgi:hypothetical protein